MDNSLSLEIKDVGSYPRTFSIYDCLSTFILFFVHLFVRFVVVFYIFFHHFEHYLII